MDLGASLPSYIHEHISRLRATFTETVTFPAEQHTVSANPIHPEQDHLSSNRMNR